MKVCRDFLFIFIERKFTSSDEKQTFYFEYYIKENPHFPKFFQKEYHKQNR